MVSRSVPSREHCGTEPRPCDPLPRQRRPLTGATLVATVALVLLGTLVAVGWGPLVTADRVVAGALYGLVHGSAAAHGVELWTEAFGTWTMRIVALATAAWLLLRRRISTAVWAAGTVFAANLAGLALKLTVGRQRPAFDDPITTAVGPSFPSGHALMAVTGTAILLFAVLPLLPSRLRPAAWAAALAVTVSTALSRPLLGVHWFSDVLAGAALGVAVVAGSLLLWTFLPAGARRWDRPAFRP
ncbi:undecaprenyl-diphosphatase [Haloactinospora alba]|uniref:Undecaprenyl-diphosphatase n=1 Tax=Haloactinospora alba TaxID=405555 RepID=A0A543NMM9_9ACTN|nr:phosphatase PAP2 family protein [Haloactinospora alba]TQN33088.1 undecaprenyl-diphosphatase [Haloactinospora alba]